MKEWLLAGVMIGCLVLAGCGGGGGANGTAAALTGSGSLQLQIDLAQLSAQGTAVKAASEPITAVTATLSRDGYGPKDFELTVSGTTATGRIDNLPLGYMHVALKAYSGTTLVYTGSTDVAVTSGPPATARVLLDPVAGSLVVEVGVNPYPGYQAINQSIGWLFNDPATGRTYLCDYGGDGWPSQVVVYGAGMVRQADFLLPAGTAVLTPAVDGTAIYLGTRDGQLYRLDAVSGTTSRIVNAGGWVRGMATINDRYLLLTVDATDTSTNLVVVDLLAASVIVNQNYGYYLAELAINPANGMAYGINANSAEQYLHRLQVDQVSGALSDARPVVSGATYPMASPVRALGGAALVTTSGGRVFTSSAVVGSDLQYVGDLTFYYNDLDGDDALHYLYVTDGEGKHLRILRDRDFAVVKSLDLPLAATRVFHTADSIFVLSRGAGAKESYVKVFSKSELGLTTP